MLDLTELNLDGRDSRVYEALLKSGLSSIRKVADYSGINRGSVYESIKKLSASGLVNFQQAGVNKKYFAEEPSKIISLINQKRTELDIAEEKTRKLIPKLTSQAAYSPYSNIKFYEDHEGVAVILHDVLDTVGKLDIKSYRAISSKPMREYLYKKFPNFTKQRVMQNIHVDVISLGKTEEEVTNADRKLLATKIGTNPSSYTIIYGSKLAIFGLNDDMNPYGLVINDQGAADMQTLLFDQLKNSL